MCGSLDALLRCARPAFPVEVLVVVNASERATEDVRAANAASVQAVRSWANSNNHAQFLCQVLHIQDLPHKHAGVGWARKIGMDVAAQRLEQAGNPSGVLHCFDADSRCTPNLHTELEAFFAEHTKLEAASIHYEHPLEGTDFAPEVYAGIVRYELFLRYFIRAQAWAGHPHAMHTIGSSMAVRANAYLAQGGMNRRKAGEDFYFLQKFIALGRCGQLTSAHVIPSPRPSDRVPFGTGKAIGDWLHGAQAEWPAYHPATLEALRDFLQLVPRFYTQSPAQSAELMATLPECIASFLQLNNAVDAVAEAQANSTSITQFLARFYTWFNAFRVLKYVHYSRDTYHADVPIASAASWLLTQLGHKIESTDLRNLLAHFRALDRA